VQLQELLDERRLEGLHGIGRVLGPKRPAVAVKGDELADATDVIELVCQLWGGACYPLLPAVEPEPALSKRWQTFLDECLIDSVWYRHLPEKAITYRSSDKRSVERELGEFLMAALDAANTRRDQWTPVVVSHLSQDDDWFIAYAGALGLWPEVPDPHLVERYQYLEGLRWDQVIETRSEVVDAPGPQDLLGRLRRQGCTTPANMSMAKLGIPRAARSASIQSQAVLPRPAETAQQVGPNIVVVYEPGNVEDLALLWNLRLANGLPSGLPLGVPRTADLGAALKYWQDKFAFQMWTLGHDRCAITSTSVDLGDLALPAANAGPLWSVVTPDEVLRDSDRPARTSLDVATFVDGQATVSAWDATDRDALGMRRSQMHDLGAVVRFTLLDRHIPPSRSFEPQYSFEAGYRGGGFEVPDQRYSSLSAVRWPTGWTVIEALARDRGLRAQPSAAGLAAASLLRRVGSLEALSALLSPKLVEFLYRLSERSGMPWFRRKLREIGAAVDEKDRQRVEEAIESLHLSARSEEDQEQTTFSELVQLLNRDSARAWLGWAEEKGLLIRGGRIRCDHCGAKSWRALEELTPHPVCRGCGRPIDSPFPPGELPFAYRASETVLQTMQHDAMVHLLAMRWFAELWRPSFDKPSGLFGAYPGVEFFEEGEADPIGEADVLLVQSDGELIPGECKRRGVGLKAADIEKLDRLADRLNSPWSFLATLDQASACPSLWTESLRQLPAKPRVALTAEHLFESMVFWPAGVNILAWRDEPQATHDEREEQFAEGLPQWLDRLARMTTMEEEMMRERAAGLSEDSPRSANS
jgi:hypothetical protein